MSKYLPTFTLVHRVTDHSNRPFDQPGCLYWLSCWYTRSELALRTNVLHVGYHVSGAFSGLVAAGITGGLDGVAGLRAWRWLFIVEGAATVAVALVALVLTPDLPDNTAWLDARERALAIWRVERETARDVDDNVECQQHAGKRAGFWHGFVLVLADVKSYLLVSSLPQSFPMPLGVLVAFVLRADHSGPPFPQLLVLFGMMAAGSVMLFFPALVATLGYGPVTALLLTVPPYGLAALTTLLNSWHADRTGERFWHIAVPLAVAVASSVLAVATINLAARYAAMMLMVRK